MSMTPPELPVDVSESTQEQTKACCATAYEGDVVAMLLGRSYHPGGAELTRRLADQLGLRPGQRVLDVASGPGSTAMLLAAEYGVRVDGVDLGEGSVAAATAAATERGLADRARFWPGDAERLPLEADTFDAVVCECALCTFPDKPTATAEFARVLIPGGRLGITDVTVDPDRLHRELRDLAGWIACLADARPLDDYAALLSAAGLRVEHTEAHNDALGRMVEQIDARLRAARMVGRGSPALASVDVERALEIAGLASDAVHSGAAGYALLIASNTPT